MSLVVNQHDIKLGKIQKARHQCISRCGGGHQWSSNGTDLFWDQFQLSCWRSWFVNNKILIAFIILRWVNTTTAVRVQLKLFTEVKFFKMIKSEKTPLVLSVPEICMRIWNVFDGFTQSQWRSDWLMNCINC